MRFASLVLASVIVATTPVAAKESPTARASVPVCAASLEKAKGATGYKLARQCSKADAKNKGDAGLQARGPVSDGSSEFAGPGVPVLGIFAVGALIGGLFVAFDGDERELPDTGGGGVDPASP